MSSAEQNFEALLAKLIRTLQEEYKTRFKACLLFGSTVKGLKPNTDIDLLLVIDGMPENRIEKNREFAAVEKACAPELLSLQKIGINLIFSPQIRSSESIQKFQNFYLDLPECNKILFDPEGLLASLLEKIRAWRISSGAKRINKGLLWYWDLSGGEKVDPNKKLGW
jgi:hypothetical protein